MKNATLPEIFLKLFGLGLLVLGLPALPWLTYLLFVILHPGFSGADIIETSVRSSTGVIYLVLGFSIFASSQRLSKRYFSANIRNSQPLSRITLQDTVYSGIGLLVALRSIPSMVSLIAHIAYLRHWQGIHTGPPMYELFIGVGSAVLFVLGFSIFFGARGLVGIRDHVRNYGIKEDS